MSLGAGCWETLELSFGRNAIEKAIRPPRVVVQFSVSMALDDPSSEEQQVKRLKQHVSRVLQVRPVEVKTHQSKEHGRKTRRRNNNIRPDSKVTNSTAGKPEPISHIITAIVQGNRVLRSDKSNRIGWRDDLDAFKPVGPSLDGSDLCTRYEIYGDLTSHRLHQTIVLRSFLALSECGRRDQHSEELLLYGKFAKLLAGIMTKLPVKRAAAADYICASLAGEMLTVQRQLCSCADQLQLPLRQLSAARWKVFTKSWRLNALRPQLARPYAKMSIVISGKNCQTDSPSTLSDSLLKIIQRWYNSFPHTQ
jgi:hypothetical protein